MRTLEPIPLDTPALRPVEIFPVQHEGRNLLLIRDPLEILDGIAALAPDPLLIVILQLADGQRHVEEIARFAREQTGLIVTADKVRNMVRELDRVGLLLSERFLELWEERRQQYRDLPARPSVVFQSEDRLKTIKELSDLLRATSTGEGAPPARLDLPHPNVRAVLAPHIDFERGGRTYAWAYKAIAEHTTAKTYIILGTLHKPCSHPFIATRKTYETPFGPVETDKEILDELGKEFGGELYADEYLHAGEHTVELQVVYLKHLLGDRPFKIVPILVGSFEEMLHVDPPVQPNEDEEVASFIQALSTIMKRHGDEVVLIGGVDFAHCGPEFGDEELNTSERLGAVRAEDEKMLRAIEEVRPAAFFDSFRATANERRVCSIAPIYCVLSALEDTHVGKTLHYGQANSDDRSCAVTFASVAFMPKTRSKIILLQNS